MNSAHRPIANDKKIQEIAIRYIRKAVCDRPAHPFESLGELHPALQGQLILADGELVIVSAFFSPESWHSFTTRRIVSLFHGKIQSLDPSRPFNSDFPNFKGYSDQGPWLNEEAELRRPGVIPRDVATITDLEYGKSIRFEYATWEGYLFPMYAAMFWERKFPYLDKLMTSAELEQYKTKSAATRSSKATH